MQQTQQIIVIVPEDQGQEALVDIQGIKTIVVKPGNTIPDNAKAAEILVVGAAEQQEEVGQALEQIKQLPNLKLLQTLGQGTEQWDDVLPSGLKVSTARGAHGGSTAELAVTALLALVRDIPFYISNQQSNVWQGRQARTLMGMNILIYGAGDVGQNIQRRLKAFDARVTIVGSHNREGVVDMATARTLLPTTGAVVMALPLTKATEYTVDADFLAALPDKAVVVNASRGGLVDQAALLNELTSGRLQAALDVVTPEPLPSDNLLWGAPGLLLTPHVAGNTVGSGERAWAAAAEQIRAYMDHAK